MSNPNRAEQVFEILRQIQNTEPGMMYTQAFRTDENGWTYSSGDPSSIVSDPNGNPVNTTLLRREIFESPLANQYVTEVLGAAPEMAGEVVDIWRSTLQTQYDESGQWIDSMPKIEQELELSPIVAPPMQDIPNWNNEGDQYVEAPMKQVAGFGMETLFPEQDLGQLLPVHDYDDTKSDFNVMTKPAPDFGTERTAEFSKEMSDFKQDSYDWSAEQVTSEVVQDAIYAIQDENYFPIEQVAQSVVASVFGAVAESEQVVEAPQAQLEVVADYGGASLDPQNSDDQYWNSGGGGF